MNILRLNRTFKPFNRLCTRYFCNPVIATKLNNGQATNIKVDMDKSKVDIRFEIKWIDYTYYCYFNGPTPNIKSAHPEQLECQEIEDANAPVTIKNDSSTSQETISWTSNENGENSCLSMYIPQDINSFSASTQGQITGI